MEEDDPLPNWFMEGWKIYGFSPLILKPYSFTLLKIPKFTPHSMLVAKVLYKTIRDLLELEDINFLMGIMRCGHIRWFVMNNYKTRSISTSTNYDEFHGQVDPNLNPFMNLNYLDLPDPHSTTIWESKKEVWVQYYSNYMIERWNYQYHTHPQIDYYTF